jgi:hypothetical protein
MPHQFTSTEPERLEGTWYKWNGRRYCRWQFDKSTATLSAARGVVKKTVNVEVNSKSVDDLMSELPQLALQLANAPKH